jgi:preprotein translocase subunit SecG
MHVNTFNRSGSPVTGMEQVYEGGVTAFGAGNLDRSMIYVVVAIHVAASSALLLLVLLHSGKGGGLSDMFGGGMGAAAQGSTVVEKNLDRITVMAALVFSFTTIGLGMLLST